MSESNQHAEQVTAVILAGGMARRMGGMDKGWVELSGKPLISHVLETIKPQVGRCLINANRSMDAYSALGMPIVSDLEGDFQGPLMGMATGMFHASTDWVMFVPCDTPSLPDDLVSRMLKMAKASGAEIAVANDGQRMQSVVALIRRELLDSLQTALKDGERKVDRWYGQHKVVEVDFSDKPDAFVNVNSRDDLAELQQMPALLGFVAWSGTGKTTLLRKLIPLLKEQGVRVGVIKHAHHKFDIDHPGKDSYELRKAGADQMLISSHTRWALMVEEDQGDYPSFARMLSRMDHSTLDLVLVEGFKREAIPKIELHRTVLEKDLIHPTDDSVIAIAADRPLALKQEMPQLDINNETAVLQFVLDYLAEQQR